MSSGSTNWACVRENGRLCGRVRLARGLEGVERGFDRQVADGMDVHVQSAPGRLGHQRIHFCGREEELSRPAGVDVRLGERGGLRRDLHHAVGEHLEARDGQVGDCAVLGAQRLDHVDLLIAEVGLDHGVGDDMGRQLAAFGQRLVDGQEARIPDARGNRTPNDPADGRVEPAGDAECVHVVNRGLARLQHGLGRGRRKTRVELDLARIDHESIRLEGRGIKAVAMLQALRQMADVGGDDPGAQPRRFVGPSGVPIRSVQHDGLIGKDARREHGIDFCGMRPVADVDAVHDQHVSQAAVLLPDVLGDELREVGNRVPGVRVIGLNQRHTPRDGMCVPVDHAGHEEAALEIDLARARARRLGDRREIADREDAVAADGHRVGVGVVGFCGEHLGVVEERRVSITGRRGGGRPGGRSRRRLPGAARCAQRGAGGTHAHERDTDARHPGIRPRKTVHSIHGIPW